MKKIVAVLGVTALFLSGCSTNETSATAPSVEPAKPSATATPSETGSDEPERSTRGNLVKVVGQGGGRANEAGEQLVDFVVNSISVDVPCTAEFATAPENGHFVVLEMAVETSPKLAEDINPEFYTGGWKAIAANGTTSNVILGTGAAYSCFPQSELLPSLIGPGEKAVGKIVLDVETPEGVLVLEDSWEWTYPQGS
ncbi:hypothetical protein E2F48_11605 [Arthrobacter crusticola]|uniref:DUF4352 domain-containing protein n=1 Tax=Arthrobacter crusticola TaxID=2547960 RepID=A0A4R5TXK7_9MICC|nr:hypothetical protein [Arthrobacter crusticola]TDK25858.1 hypothetical protein E2F48_11605 [Arthrobacter crusticola]